jgi:hypothetical protein
MSPTEKGNIWAYKRSRSNGDETGVQDGAVEIDKDVGTKPNICTIVDTNGRLYPWFIDE